MIEFDCLLARKDFTLDAAFSSQAPVTALFGPSGSGKTTILRLMAGLERPDRGRIAVGGDVLVDTAQGIFVSVHRRRAALVFQDAQLFPHLSVAGNLSYARRYANGARNLAFDRVVGVLGLGGLLERRSRSLSGGERQRVAIGRALLASARVLLLDEPLAALDMALKLDILGLIETVRDEFKIPIVYVSHTASEVARLASVVVRTADGRVTGTGAPAEMLAPEVAMLAGDRFEAMSIVTGRVNRVDHAYAVTIVDHPAGRIVVPYLAKPGQTEIQVAIHATNVTLALSTPTASSVRTVLEGTLQGLSGTSGPLALASVQLKGGELIQAYLTRLAVAELGLVPGMTVFALAKTVALDERGVRALPRT